MARRSPARRRPPTGAGPVRPGGTGAAAPAPAPPVADPATGPVPATVLVAALVVIAEAAVLLVLGGWELLRTVTGTPADRAGALWIGVLALVGAAALAAGGLALRRGRSAALAPVLVAQILALPVGWDQLRGAVPLLGAAILGPAVVVLVLLLTPSAQRALRRR